MKNILRYLWRDKIDLIMFLLVVAAVVQIGFIGKDLTPGFAVLALYCFGVMHRLGTFTDIIKDQQRQIEELQNANKIWAETWKTEINEKPKP